MAKQAGYLTQPLASAKMPPGIPYIVGNEAAERFSFYGMSAILTVFMVDHLMGRDGLPDHMSKGDANYYFHSFVAAVYFFPVIGALVSDGLLGKYRTILSFSAIYCLGHLALALDETRVGLFTGLALIAFGAGGIKPCVSAHVGDQFGKTNQHLLAKVFGWFYFSINLGAFISQLLIPELLDRFGPHVAFGVPGILMLLATIVFWLGRNKFVHVPPGGMKFVREAFGRDGRRTIASLLVIYVFVAVFYALYYQAGSEWVLQAKVMDRQWLGIEWLPAQIQAVNGVLILLFIPLFSYIVYPAIDKVFPLTPLRKIAIGLFVTSLAFVVSAWIESQLAAGLKPNIAWQVLAFAILTAAEVLVSVTCLEFSYTQAPRAMKSVVMAMYLLSITAGNEFTALIHFLNKNGDGTDKLVGADYYWFYVGLMTAAAIVFIFVARRYREKTYIQPEQALGGE
jgi:POT family proton-dependent oligopeptide transporter